MCAKIACVATLSQECDVLCQISPKFFFSGSWRNAASEEGRKSNLRTRFNTSATGPGVSKSNQNAADRPKTQPELFKGPLSASHRRPSYVRDLPVFEVQREHERNNTSDKTHFSRCTSRFFFKRVTVLQLSKQPLERRRENFVPNSAVLSDAVEPKSNPLHGGLTFSSWPGENKAKGFALGMPQTVRRSTWK